MDSPFEHPSGFSVTIRESLKMLRIHQWVKNLFVFLPLFFSLRITEVDLVLQAMIAFAAFCLISSSVYIFNDLRDIESDRLHPKKKDRPLASGRITKPVATKWLFLLLVTGIVVVWTLGPVALSLTFLYLFLNLAYTLKLKHIPIFDISIIAIGFEIRIFMGGVTTGTPIYMWIVIMTFLLALFIALSKRRHDMIVHLETNSKIREIMDGYNLVFIDAAMVIMAAVIIVSYIMYTVSPDVVAKFHSDKLYLTTGFVVLGILRHLQITLVEENSGAPTEILFTDRFIQLTLCGWLIAFALLIYSPW